MNPRGGVKRDPCPEDLLSVAENCLDLLMRPDKELCPGRATLAPRLCAEGANGKGDGGGERGERRRGERAQRRASELEADAIYWPLNRPLVAPVTVRLALLLSKVEVFL